MQDSERKKISEKEELIQLPKIIDNRGNLSFIEENNHIPFKIARSYWIYDVPGGEIRGSHAFREQEEFIVALSGSFDLVLNNGDETRRYSLNRSYMGVYVSPMTWRTMKNFSTNSLCLVLSSTLYDEKDYIRNYKEFCLLLAQKEKPENVNSLFNHSAINFTHHKPIKNTVYNCDVFELPKVHDRRGNLTSVNNNLDIPFDIKRVFYIYDVPSGAIRGAHAHKETWEFIIATSSSFDILLDDGRNKKTVHLNRPNYGLLVPPGIWCQLQNFSSAAVCMILTSHPYDAEDYINNYNDYLSFQACK